jgi:hypothetical protein
VTNLQKLATRENASKIVHRTGVIHMTENELIKELERRTVKAKTYASILNPVVFQMQKDQQELFSKSLPLPSNLKSTKPTGINQSPVLFASKEYEYLVSFSNLHIVRKNLRTDKSEVLLSMEYGSVEAFIDGDWLEDIIRFAAILHEALERERIREQQARERLRQKELHDKAKAFGIPSPFNFPEPSVVVPAPPPTPLQEPYVKPIKPDTIYKFIAAVLIIAFVIYFIARMNLSFR